MSDELTRIVPLVRGDVERGASPPQVSKGAGEMVDQRLAPGLRIVYALDRPDRWDYLAAEQLAKLDVRMDELLDLAICNLRDRLPPLQLLDDPPCYRLIGDGNLESSLLLLTEFWHDPWPNFVGDLVIAVPTRGRLDVTSSLSPKGLAALRQGIEEKWSDPAFAQQRVSRSLYRWAGDHWLEFEPANPDKAGPSLALPRSTVSFSWEIPATEEPEPS
jgi:hypothetical protein